MKKTTQALAILFFLTSTLNADPAATQTVNKNAFLKIELKDSKTKINPITLTYEPAPITISHDEVKKMVNDLVDTLKEQGKEIPEEKISAIYDMISEYLAAESAKLFAALQHFNQNPKGMAEVMSLFKKAAEKIIKEYFMQEMIKEAKDKITEKDYLDGQNEIATEKGDQVLLNVIMLPQGTEGKRLIKKMQSISNIDKKSTEWTKLTSQYKSKTLDAVLISDLPDVLKDQLKNAKTGDVVTLDVPNQENPKNTQSTLFFVMKRERINGELLMKALNAKIMGDIEKAIMEKIMQQVTVVKFDSAGKIIDASKTKAPAAPAESAAPAA